MPHWTEICHPAGGELEMDGQQHVPGEELHTGR